MVSALASSAVDRVLESRSDKIKDYEIGIWCFFAKHAILRRKSEWPGMRIMCQSGATCISTDCCFSELVL